MYNFITQGQGETRDAALRQAQEKASEHFTRYGLNGAVAIAHDDPLIEETEAGFRIAINNFGLDKPGLRRYLLATADPGDERAQETVESIMAFVD